MVQVHNRDLEYVACTTYSKIHTNLFALENVSTSDILQILKQAQKNDQGLLLQVFF